MTAATTSPPTLLVVPALRAERCDEGGFLLTHKFVDGVLEYVRRWPGPVRVAVERTERADANLDPIAVRNEDVPFELAWLDGTVSARRTMIAAADFVLASLVPQHEQMALLCADLGVPMAFVAEYSLRTRRQIVRAEVRNPLRHAKRWWGEGRRERRNHAAVALATGIQCNGTPVYEAYRPINDRPLLYFDTRVPRAMVAEEDAVRARTEGLAAGAPLRLAFSGRLAAMKGADHLPEVARQLDRLGVAYEMQICGDGPLAPRLRRLIAKYRLDDRVRMTGVLDFREALVPLVTHMTDLFVCCHRQGDPSCTYLETMACGTPIVGYDNEAFSGVVATSGVGWPTPLDDPAKLAAQIAAIDGDRDTLAEASLAARAFAAHHTLEDTMDRRVAHMRACLDGGAGSMEAAA